MISDKQVEAAMRQMFAGAEFLDSPHMLKLSAAERMRAALEAADAAAWEPIESAPSLERVIVSGIQPRSGTVAAYRWYHEDATDEKGVPIEHTNADLFRLIPQLPKETT